MSEYVMTDRMLESIAHNLCSLHDFDPAFVMQNEKFARAVLTEYFRAAPAPQGIGRDKVEAIVRDGLTNVPMVDASQSEILRIRTQQMTDRILALLPTEPPAQGEG